MTRHAARRLPLSLVGLVGCLGCVLVAGTVGGAAPAVAAPPTGPVLIASDPGDHETVMSAPDHVTLTFDQALGDAAMVSIAVSGPGAVRVDRGSVTVDGVDASIRLRSDLASGDYMVGFLVARTGGGSVSGSLIFELKVPAPHQVVTDPPSVIASALAGLASPTPAPTRPARVHRSHPPTSATPVPSAAAGAPQQWWRRSSVIGAGAVALLVLAGMVVFLPGRRDDG